MFGDEARFGRMNRPRPCWAPIGIRPEVACQLIREYVYLYGAVSPKDGTCIFLILPAPDTECFQIFLETLAKKYHTELILLFVDGAGNHCSDELEIPANIILHLLPPYSPELNPQENIWDEIREKIFKNYALKSMSDVNAKLDEASLYIERNRTLVKSIASFPYIAKSYRYGNGIRGRAQQGGVAERKAMIDREHDLPITRQAELVRISRGRFYYGAGPVPASDLTVMRRLDRLHLEFPFAGSRMLQGLLVAEGCKIGRRHVKTLMQRMGIEALYRRPRTTKPEPGHKIYPYLLRGMEITRPNQVWAMDITCIAMSRGFVYLAVVLDWFSRRVLSWRVSITMEAAFCIQTLEDALAHHGKPDIFNTDQGSQFTGAAFTGVLIKNAIAISMDGKGAWRDNVFVERLWRSVKYEEVYLRAYDSVSEAR